MFNTTLSYTHFRICQNFPKQKSKNLSIAILKNLSFSKTFQVLQNCIINFQNFLKPIQTLILCAHVVLAIMKLLSHPQMPKCPPLVIMNTTGCGPTAFLIRPKHRIGSSWPLLRSIRRILSRVTASGYIFRVTFRSLSDVLYSDEYRMKKAFSMSK